MASVSTVLLSRRSGSNLLADVFHELFHGAHLPVNTAILQSAEASKNSAWGLTCLLCNPSFPHPSAFNGICEDLPMSKWLRL